MKRTFIPVTRFAVCLLAAIPLALVPSNAEARTLPRSAGEAAYGLSISSPCRTQIVVRSFPWRTGYAIHRGGLDGPVIARGVVGPTWVTTPRHTPGEVVVHHIPHLRANQKVTFGAAPDWGTFIFSVYANPRPCR